MSQLLSLTEQSTHFMTSATIGCANTADRSLQHGRIHGMEHPWEDHLLERKVESDLKDLLKTLVAFGNSVKPGHIATILIGETDDGAPVGVTNPDSIQERVRKEADKVYPPLVWKSMVYERDSRFCVRVEIEHSGETPHFGGQAWVRRGSSTVVATEEVFQRLVEMRIDVVHELARWLGQEITVSGDPVSVPLVRDRGIGSGYRTIYAHRWPEGTTASLVHVNRFWITLQTREGKRLSEPLRKLTLTYDDRYHRLHLIVAF